MKSLFTIFGYLIIGIIFFSSLQARGQSNTLKIATYTKIWGFLKYHHPTVAAGSIDWDSVYVNNIAKIEAANSNADFSRVVLTAIENLDNLSTKVAAKVPDSLFAKNHSLAWIDEDVLITPKLKSELKSIYTHRYQGANRYAKLQYQTVNYSGEKAYDDMVLPSRSYRLLFLARFWNAINYFAPYKYEVGENWDNVLTRFIPQIINATDTLSYYKALLQLTVSLHDGHSFLALNNGDNRPINDLVYGKYTAPIYTLFVNEMLVVRKPANDSLCRLANIHQGDVILSIDKEPVSARMRRIGLYVSASNNASRENFLPWWFFDTHNPYQLLRIMRGNKIFTTKVQCILTDKRDWRELTRYTYNKTGYKIMGKHIAYVYAGQILNRNLNSIKALIKTKKAVIFDTRNYSDNDEFYNVFADFLSTPKEINLALCPSAGNPGYFQWENSPRIGNINKSPYKGNVIILADERNQSQGEYSVMALQTIPNSVTIGNQTAGSDGVHTTIPMGGKLVLSYSGYGIFYPNKTPTQRRGVKIDIIVKPTLKSVIGNKDEALEIALMYLKKYGID